jgi:cytochrome c551/c552
MAIKKPSMKRSRIIFCIVSLYAGAAFAGPPVEAGKSIFNSRCAACHNVNKVVTGPALAGVADRRSMDWIVKFVHSSQTVIKSGDSYAVALYEKFNKIPMPDHPDLSEDDIKGIVEFIRSSTVDQPKTTLFRPEKKHPAYMPLSINNYYFFGAYFALVLLLIGSLLALVQIKEVQRKGRES